MLRYEITSLQKRAAALGKCRYGLKRRYVSFNKVNEPSEETHRPRTLEEKAIQSAKVRRWRETEGKKARERAIQEWKAKHGGNTGNRSGQ